MSFEVVSAVIGLLLTLMVFSYLIGDNPLFRLAVYLFIGVASGYAVTVIWHSVLVPRLLDPLGNPNRLAWTVVPLILSISLWAKLSPRISRLGGFAMAVIVGVGAATAIGGALTGTLIPQVEAAMDSFDSSEGAVMLAGTVLTLAYFQFGAKRAPDDTIKRGAVIELLAWLGRLFIAVTLGVLFAGVYLSALTALIERLSSIINLVKSLLGL
ncbi:MAG: hypothetical protein HXY42_12485 [Chloroflexi bacterium]|nr:hypothetical protein [Chloroflexota bacterium]